MTTMRKKSLVRFPQLAWGCAVVPLQNGCASDDTANTVAVDTLGVLSTAAVVANSLAADKQGGGNGIEYAQSGEAVSFTADDTPHP
jgi:hypothetical protein